MRKLLFVFLIILFSPVPAMGFEDNFNVGALQWNIESGSFTFINGCNTIDSSRCLRGTVGVGGVMNRTFESNDFFSIDFSTSYLQYIYWSANETTDGNYIIVAAGDNSMTLDNQYYSAQFLSALTWYRITIEHLNNNYEVKLYNSTLALINTQTIPYYNAVINPDRVRISSASGGQIDNVVVGSSSATSTGTIFLYDYSYTNRIAATVNLSNIKIITDIIQPDYSMRYWLVMTRPDSTNQIIELTTLPNPLITNLAVNQVGVWEFDLLECNGSCYYLDTDYLTVFSQANTTGAIAFYDSSSLTNLITDGANLSTVYIRTNILNKNSSKRYWLTITRPDYSNQAMEITTFPNPLTSNLILSQTGNWEFDLLECDENCTFLDTQYFYVYPNTTQPMTLTYHVEGQGQIYVITNGTIVGVAMPGFDANVTYSIGDNIAWYVYPYVDQYIVSVCDFPLTECSTNASYNYTVTGQLPQQIIATFAPQANLHNMTLIYHVEGQGQIYAYRNDTLMGVAMPGFDANVSYGIGDGISWLAYPYIDNYIASVCDFPLTECDTAAWHSYTVTGQLPLQIIVTFSTKNQSWPGPNVTVTPIPPINPPSNPDQGLDPLIYASFVIFLFGIVGAAVSKSAVGFLGGVGIGFIMSSAGGLIDQAYFYLFVLFLIMIIAFFVATKITSTRG